MSYFDPKRPVEKRECLVQPDGSVWIFCPTCQGSGLVMVDGDPDQCTEGCYQGHVEIDPSTPLA